MYLPGDQGFDILEIYFQLKLYLNGLDMSTFGVLSTTTGNSAASITPPGSLYLGADAQTRTQFTDISLDEVWLSPYFIYTPSMFVARAESKSIINTFYQQI